MDSFASINTLNKPLTKQQKKEQKDKIKSAKKITTVFKEYATQGTKDRTELARKIYAYFTELGLEKNKHGKDFRIDRIQMQISQIVKYIKARKGLEYNAWWSQYEVIETNEQFKIIPAKDEEEENSQLVQTTLEEIENYINR